MLHSEPFSKLSSALISVSCHNAAHLLMQTIVAYFLQALVLETSLMSSLRARFFSLSAFAKQQRHGFDAHLREQRVILFDSENLSAYSCKIRASFMSRLLSSKCAKLAAQALASFSASLSLLFAAQVSEQG